MGKKIRGDQQITSAGTILVVDDEEDFLWATDTMLQKAGYSVIQAKNGEKVLKLLEKDIPDLILMDYRLPNRNGLQVAADVKQRIPTVPIIMLTGYAEVGSAVEAMKIGVYDYVTKPVDIDDLLFTIKRCLEKQDLIEEVGRLRKAIEELERLITTISTRFINLSSNEIDSGISEAVKEIGAFTDVDRSYAFVLSDNGTKIDDTYEWCAEGVKPQTQNLKGISINDELPWFAKRLKEFEVVHVPCVADLRPEASDEKEYFQAQDVQSLLAIPMTYGGFLAGFLRFDSTRANKKWTEGIIALLGVVGEIFANALERKRTEVALQESEERFRTVADFTQDWEYWIAPDGQYIYVSPSCEKVTGYGPEEFLNDPGLLKKITHPDDHSTVVNHLGAEEDQEKLPSIDFRIITLNGEERWISHVCQAVYGADGAYLGRRGSNRDISKQKLLQEELLKSKKLKSLGVLAGGIAHDFNNLMSAIVGNISLARTEMRPGSKGFKNLVEAEKASIRTKELTTRLITFSEGGWPVKETASIGDLVKNSVDSSLKGSDIICKFVIPDDIPPVKVDEEQMKQAIHNIITNAQEAMAGQGRINVSCENVNIGVKDTLTLKDGKYVKISIEDQGPGIPEEDLLKIFDPYFSTKDMGTQKGMGLGLAVSDSIVKQHDGLITVTSELGTGTIFSIYLPASEKEIVEAAPIKKPVPEKSVTRGGKILVMDDEEPLRDVCNALLTHIGYRVEVAVEGIEAIEMYQEAMASEKPFDVAILDLTNKIGMGGAETIVKLLEIDPGVKAIVATGYSGDPIISNFRGHGFCGVLPKPFTLDQLRTALQDAIAGE